MIPMARRTSNRTPVELQEAEASEPVLIRCEKYPSLLVTSPRVEFVNGLATVPEDVADVVLGLSPEFGISRVDPAEGTPDEDTSEAGEEESAGDSSEPEDPGDPDEA